MNILYNNHLTNTDLTSLIKLLEVTSTSPIVVMVNIRFENLNGTGGDYTNRLMLDDTIILPDNKTTIDANTTRFVIQGRQVTMLEGQTLQFFAQGVSGDTNAGVLISLFDVTPLTANQITDMGDTITAQVLAAIANHDIIVRPITKVLSPGKGSRSDRIIIGPCKQKVTPVPQIQN